MIWRLVLGAACIGMLGQPAFADVDAETESLVQNVAMYGSASEAFIRGRAVFAVPLAPKGGCTTVGVIDQASRGRSRGGPRISNYSVCRDDVEHIEDVSPGLPEDGEFKQALIMTVRGAFRHGGRPYFWQNYSIDTRRLSQVDMQGCAQVETTVASGGLLVSYNVGKICL